MSNIFSTDKAVTELGHVLGTEIWTLHLEPTLVWTSHPGGRRLVAEATVAILYTCDKTAWFSGSASVHSSSVLPMLWVR